MMEPYDLGFEYLNFKDTDSEMQDISADEMFARALQAEYDALDRVEERPIKRLKTRIGVEESFTIGMSPQDSLPEGALWLASPNEIVGDIQPRFRYYQVIVLPFTPRDSTISAVKAKLDENGTEYDFCDRDRDRLFYRVQLIDNGREVFNPFLTGDALDHWIYKISLRHLETEEVGERKSIDELLQAKWCDVYRKDMTPHQSKCVCGQVITRWIPNIS